MELPPIQLTSKFLAKRLERTIAPARSSFALGRTAAVFARFGRECLEDVLWHALYRPGDAARTRSCVLHPPLLRFSPLRGDSSLSDLYQGLPASLLGQLVPKGVSFGQAVNLALQGQYVYNTWPSETFLNSQEKEFFMGGSFRRDEESPTAARGLVPMGIPLHELIAACPAAIQQFFTLAPRSGRALESSEDLGVYLPFCTSSGEAIRLAWDELFLERKDVEFADMYWKHDVKNAMVFAPVEVFLAFWLDFTEDLLRLAEPVPTTLFDMSSFSPTVRMHRPVMEVVPRRWPQLLKDVDKKLLCVLRYSQRKLVLFAGELLLRESSSEFAAVLRRWLKTVT